MTARLGIVRSLKLNLKVSLKVLERSFPPIVSPRRSIGVPSPTGSPSDATNGAGAKRTGLDRIGTERRRVGDGHDSPSVSRFRAAQGELVLSRRRRFQRSHPGGPGRPVQGRSRLPRRQGNVVSVIRGAVHHPPDHHRDQDRDPFQARAAEHVRVVQPHARRPGGRQPTARWATRCPAPRSTIRPRA